MRTGMANKMASSKIYAKIGIMLICSAHGGCVSGIVCDSVWYIRKSCLSILHTFEELSVCCTM